MKYGRGKHPKTLAGLRLANERNIKAPDNPGETETITVRVRIDQKEWLDEQEESRSYLVRQALDLYIGDFKQK